MSKHLKVKGFKIKINQDDYISLTDIAKQSAGQSAGETIRYWMKNKDTLLFLETWEDLHNPDFKDGHL